MTLKNTSYKHDKDSASVNVYSVLLYNVLHILETITP